jgi:predicted permease
MFGQLNADRPGGDHPLATRYFTWHKIMGRLKEGVPLSQAQAAMRMLAGRIYVNAPINTETNVVLLPGAHGFTEGVNESRMPLNLLLATAALVLLIACANLANIQLARSATRTRDFAIRLALGAGRGRVMRELLTESLLLSLTGGALGLFVANWLARSIEYFRPPSLSLDTAAGLDARVLAFAFIAAVLTGVLFGLAPAWRASRPQLSPELKGSGWSMEARSGRWSLRGALVVAQVALSLLVLVGAGLCLRSLNKLQALNPGVEPSQVALMDFDLGLNNYTPSRAADFYERLLAQARVQQGVESASLVQVTPLNGGQPGGMSIERIEGSANAAKRGLSADVNVVASDYFRTLGIPLLRGREFSKLDNENGLKAVVINEAFARAYLPETDPLGKHLILPGLGEQKPVEIVGVVKDDHSRSLKDPPRRTMYFPVAQQPALNLTLAVRTGLNTAAAIAGLRQLAKQIDSNVPVFHVRTLAQQKTGFLSLQRMVAALLGGFGLLALLLAALGIYGVLAYSVSRRTREIGMRMALGAQVADVLGLVLGQGLRLVLAGMAIGFASALMATRLLRGFLFEITPLDPFTYGVVLVLLAGVALLASWLPARRAANVNPLEALRSE